MELTVKRIEKNRLNAFIKLPFRLYKDDPLWVAPLISEMRHTLDVSKNVFLRDAKPVFFMAFRGKKAVARVLAGLQVPMIKKTGVIWAFFSLFEAEDMESGMAVMRAAEDYALELGAEKFEGPQSPTNGEDNRALLVEGFEIPPALYTAYNPPWYKDVFERFA